MTLLDRLIPTPRLVELNHVDVAAPVDVVWEHVRHGNLATSPFIRALFAIRTIPSRLRGEPDEGHLQIDELRSTPERPGFRLMLEDPPHELAVGAIGKVWHAQIPFVHVRDAWEYERFDDADFAKVAWAIRVSPHEAGTRVEIEVRVDTTDDDAWQKFERYFRFIGVGSHFIRHVLLHALSRKFGPLDEDHVTLPGDELIADAGGQFTHAIDIHATPEAIWPWLVQMGCNRGGYYSYDVLDNGNERSARELHPDLMNLAVGDRIPATPDNKGSFEVLRIEKHRALIFGGLFDTDRDEQRAFAAARGEGFWQVTWAFVLEPIDAHTTRLHTRARGAFSRDGRLHALYIRPIHWLMETRQLQNLKARAEGTLPRDSTRDVLEGMGGAVRMLGAMLTPFLEGRRMRWGCSDEVASRAYPGDKLVATPRWSWTHAIEIDAPAADVWGWIAQIGADRGGFYSYQWLENVAGCELRNAERVHREWEARAGDSLTLHPKMPPLTIVEVFEGRYFIAHGPADRTQPIWADGTWLFFVEPLGDKRCRFISRFRVDYSDDLKTRMSYAATRPIGFVMDRRMLLGVKERAERRFTRFEPRAPL
jgi:hypothetical protein